MRYFSPSSFVCALGAACIGALLGGLPGRALAQNYNVLGLPAVPQAAVVPKPAPPASSAKAGPSAAGASGAAKGRNKTAPAPAAGGPDLINDAQAKSVLSGGVVLSSSYQDTSATVRVTTNTAYQGDALRSQALTAARLVQRDVRLACGKQCQPGSMAAPVLLADGKLQFDIVIAGLGRNLSNEDMVTLVLGKPLPVVALVPAAAAVSATNATAASVSAQATPTAPVPATPAAPAAPAASAP